MIRVTQTKIRHIIQVSLRWDGMQKQFECRGGKWFCEEEPDKWVPCNRLTQKTLRTALTNHLQEIDNAL